MLEGLLLIQLAAVASPGPNALLVLHTAAAESRRAGVMAALGVAAGGLVWATAIALGLGVVLRAAPGAADVLRVLGGAYLVVLGARTALAARRPLPVGPPAAGSGRRSALRGALTNLSNPKAAVYYVSVFGTVLAPDASAGRRAAAIATVVTVTALWYGALALLASTPRARAGYVRGKPWIDRVAGVVMAALGVLLALG